MVRGLCQSISERATVPNKQWLVPKSGARNWSHGRLPDLMNHIFKSYENHLPREEMAAGCTIGTRLVGKGSVMLWEIFCWEILAPGIHVDVTLTCTTYLKIVADHIHLLMAMVFPYGSGLFQ